MYKIKTRKTLTKRIKITKSGMVFRKSVRMGHLKIKLDNSAKQRKTGLSQITNKEYLKTLKKLMGFAGRNIK